MLKVSASERRLKLQVDEGERERTDNCPVVFRSYLNACSWSAEGESGLMTGDCQHRLGSTAPFVWKKGDEVLAGGGGI